LNARAAPPGVGTTSARWLFSQHFLLDRLPAWADFAALDIEELRADLSQLWEARGASLPQAHEGDTEERFVRPVLRLLGHEFALFAEIPGTGKRPDYLLYVDGAERDAAEVAGPQAKIDRARGC
jgi:hypothetical protein